MKNKQHGFVAMVGLLITLSFLSYAFVLYSEKAQKERIKSDTQSFYNRLLFLKQQIHAFNADQYQNGRHINSIALFPETLEKLEGVYIRPCLQADSAKGYCTPVGQTPWGTMEYELQRIEIDEGIHSYRAVLSFQLPDQNNPAYSSELSMTVSMLSQMPNVRYDDALNQITMYVERPDMAFAYDGLVKRSGDDSTLLGDWDTGGNFAITNVKDITIRNVDGSQRLVSQGLIQIVQVQDGDIIQKPKCPEGQKPRLTLNSASTEILNEYTQTGSVKPFVGNEDNSSWTINLEIRAVVNDTGNNKIISKGAITAFIQCEGEK